MVDSHRLRYNGAISKELFSLLIYLNGDPLFRWFPGDLAQDYYICPWLAVLGVSVNQCLLKAMYVYTLLCECSFEFQFVSGVCALLKILTTSDSRQCTSLYIPQKTGMATGQNTYNPPGHDSNDVTTPDNAPLDKTQLHTF